MILHAGPIHILYDNGFLRYLKYGDSEILRMIYFSLRNENWATYKPIVENEILDIQEDHFNIAYDCFHENKGQRIYHWRALIKGNPDGSIEFEINGKAMSEVIRNRAGFCVLHPIQGLAGKPCTIFHPSGSPSQTHFPLRIEPSDPFKLIKSMQWQVDGHDYTLDFEGDLFETEDQRNWSDNSYKTFCTPLSIPFPVHLKAGDTVYQKIYFKPVELLAPVPVPENKIIITRTHQKFKSPKIGIGASTELRNLNEEVIGRLKSLGLDHYRMEIFPENINWKPDAEHHYKNSVDLGIPLYIVLHLTDSFKEQIENFIAWCQTLEQKPSHVLFLSEGKKVTSQAIIDLVPAMKLALPGIHIGAGTDFGFTEINRNRFNAHVLDFIAFSVNPQMHASDDLTIIENIETLTELTRSAKEIFGDSMSVHISPLTFRMRLNPNATNPDKKQLANEEKGDPRQQTDFGAAYTLGSLKALAIGGCEAVTLYQTIGNQGILSEQGDRYPIYHILKEWSEMIGDVILMNSTHPLLLDSILLEKDDFRKLILVNYSSFIQSVIFEDSNFELLPLEIKYLNLG